MTKAQKPLTEAQIKRLPWPKSLFDGTALTTDEAYEIGKILAEQIYAQGGRSSRGRKPWSLRRVGALLGIRGGMAKFTRCAQVWQMASDLGMKPPMSDIPLTVLVNLARLPSADRKRIARQAIKEGWTRQQVLDLVGDTAGDRRIEAGLSRVLEVLRSLSSSEVTVGSEAQQKSAAAIVKQIEKQLVLVSKKVQAKPVKKRAK